MESCHNQRFDEQVKEARPFWHGHDLKHEHSHLCWQMGSVFGDGQKGTDGLLARKPGLGHSYFSKVLRLPP